MSKPTELAQTVPDEMAPPGWTLETISDLVGKDGVFIDGDWVESKDQNPDGDVRLIQLADIGDGGYRNKSQRFLTYKKAVQLGCTFLQKGDVLVARMPDPLGRACLFPGDPKKSVTVVDVAIVRPGARKFSTNWLMYFINAPAFRKTVASMQSGSTRKRISRGNLAKISLPIPPESQQIRIVAEIEKQFSRLDEAVAGLKRAKANLKRYKAAVLKAAVEGKLTEQWRKAHPDVEPASKLLERILGERREKWKLQIKNRRKRKYVEPQAPRIGILPTLPETWTWARLEAISKAVGGFAFESKKFTPTGFQVLKMANIRMGRIDLTQNPSFIQDLEPDVVSRYGLLDGDMVVTLTGTRKKRDYGYIAVVRNPKDLLLNQRIALLRSMRGVLPEFLQIAMQSEDYRNRFFAYETGNVGQGNVGMASITEEPIPLAPLPEQQQIVAEVERRLSVVEALDTEVTANLQRAERLRQSILKKAFTGQLTSQVLRFSSKKVGV